jgi:hypothetical protein
VPARCRVEVRCASLRSPCAHRVVMPTVQEARSAPAMHAEEEGSCAALRSMTRTSRTEKKILILHEHRNDAGSPRVLVLAPASSIAATASRPRAPARARTSLPSPDPLTVRYPRDASASVPVRALHARTVRMLSGPGDNKTVASTTTLCLTPCHRLAHASPLPSGPRADLTDENHTRNL